MELSIVIPLYNEEENIDQIFTRFNSLFAEKFSGVDCEVILVNDGSRDDSLEKMLELHKRDKMFKILNLSRNFGHQIAITAGIEHAKGDAVAVIDGDLQDPPELIADMYEKYKEGFDVVYGQRKDRDGESAFKLLTASLFYRLLKSISGIQIPVDTGDFRLMSRRAVEAFLKIRESHRFVRGLVSWVGYKQVGIPYDRDKRFAGETKYPLVKMLAFAWDGITSFSILPLRLASWLGVFTILGGLTFLLFVAYTYFVNPEDLEKGWSSLIIVITLLGGVQLLILGLIGEYLGRISDEIKRRPLYFVDQFHE